jgi:hypothetical protein
MTMANEPSMIACCQEVPHAPELMAASTLLERMLVTGYYNGPLSGFLQCPTCGSTFYFFTIDWSRDKFTRVIALRPLPGEAMQRLVNFFSESPQWPQWIPRKMQRPSD